MVFLSYSGYLYFDTYVLSHKLQISIQNFSVAVQNSKISTETVILLENPSGLELKITHIHEEIYGDPMYTVFLGEYYLRPPSSIGYSVLVPPNSNDTVPIKISIEDPPESSIGTWFIKLSLRIEDVPFVERMYLKEYLAWSS